jgi:hypothetical protein
MTPLVPFARTIERLQERRRDRLDVDAEEAARTLDRTRRQVERLTAALAASAPEFRAMTPAIATRAREYVSSLGETLDRWHSMYDGFDPLFTWWVRKPHEELAAALEAYGAAIQQRWPG